MIFDYYRDFSLKKIFTEKFQHIWLLVFWPIFYTVFLLLEARQGIDWIAVKIPFDDVIPFCEYFIIPYYFWFVYIIWMLVHTFFMDVDTFKKYMWFIIISYSITCFIYLIFPTEQNLRPDLTVRDNIFEDIVYHLHTTVDNNKDVCPSIHVTGSFAVLFAAWNSKLYRGRGWKITFVIATISISISTVFLKQHSVIDIIAALVLCFILYPFVFKKINFKINKA